MSQSEGTPPSDTALIATTDPAQTQGLFYTIAELRGSMFPVGYLTPADQINAAAAAAAQATANAALPSATLGQPFGPVQSDATNKVPIANLPSAAFGSSHFVGVWNAQTNSPSIVSGTAPDVASPIGAYYVVSVAGTETIDGNSTWNAGDWIIWNGSTWDHIGGQVNPVSSVAGLQGAVTTSQLAGALAGSIGLSATGGTLNVVLGTTGNTAAAGNDSRITGALQSSNNLSDLKSPANARFNLGLTAVATSNFNLAGGPARLDAYGSLSGQILGPNSSTFPELSALQAYAATDLLNGQIANVSGYSNPFDRSGGPPFVWNSTSTVTADGVMVVNPTGNTGTGRWIRQFSGPVNVRWFGAVGDYNGTTGTDDTATFQAAINWCEANPLHITSYENNRVTWWPLHIPASPVSGSYLVTTSLNATCGIASNGYANFEITGDGTNASVIVGKLTAAHPILDLAGNSGAKISNLSILPGGGSETASLLISTTNINPEGGGNTIIRNVNLQAGAVLCASDLCVFENVQFENENGWALCAGGLNGCGIVSAYQTLGSGNITQTYFINCDIRSGSTTTGAAWFDAPDLVMMLGGYITVTGAAGTRPCIVRFSGNGGVYAEIFGTRTENQSSQTNLPIFQSYNDGTGAGPVTGKFIGNFETDGAGPVFDVQPVNGPLNNATFFNAGDASAMFSAGSVVQNFEGETSTGTTLCLGALSTNSFNIRWIGQNHSLTQTVLTNNPTLKGLNITDSTGVNYNTVNDTHINPNAPSTFLFRGGDFILEAGNLLAAYTGSSGLVQGLSVTLPAGIFVPPSAWNAAGNPLGKISMKGLVEAGAAAAGEIQFQLVQGANRYNFNATGIAAYVSASMNLIEIEMTINYYRVVTCKVIAGGVAYLSQNQNCSGLSLSSAITLNVLVSNTANSPYQLTSLAAGF